MRFLIAAAYLLLTGVSLWLGTKQMPAAMKRAFANISKARTPKAPARQAARLPALTVGILLIAFVQFYLIAGLFPGMLILALAIINIVLLTGMYVLRAALGLDTSDNRRKTFTVSFLWGMVAGRTYSVFLTSLGLSFLVLWQSSVIWVYFSKYPDGSDKLAWLAFFHLGVPVAYFQVFASIASWSQLASPHVDDDVRNASFLHSLNLAITGTVYVLYPAYLIIMGGSQLFSHASIWILMSLPILIFAAGTLLPFVVGVFRYRIEAKTRLEWRRKWVAKMLDLSKPSAQQLLPAGRQQLLEELESQIELRLAENRLFTFFRHEAIPSPETRLQSERESGQGGERFLEGRVAEQSLPNDALVARAPAAEGHPIATINLPEEAVEFFRHELPALRGWDVSLRDIVELNELLRTGTEAKWDDYANYLKGKTESYAREAKDERTTSKRNVIVAFLMSVMTGSAASAVIQGFKSYHSDILAFIGTLVAH